MNLYKLFTSSGTIYYARATFSCDAIAKVERASGERVSCYFGPLNYTPSECRIL